MRLDISPYFSRLILVPILCFLTTIIAAQSPPDLGITLEWSAGYNGIADVEAAFNQARRAEEDRFDLPTGELGTLSLPDGFESWSAPEKVLYLVNAERICRGGVDYDGSGYLPPAMGKPLTAIESHLSAIAQGHADWLVANNEFSHAGASGKSSFTRIDEDPVLGSCHEFMSYGENLYIAGNSASGNPLVVERAVFSWIYRSDGHRRGCLIQSSNQYGATGYYDNEGESGEEGFIGVATAGANNGNYNPFNWGFVDRTDVVVFMFIDPTDQSSCGYDLTYLPGDETPPQSDCPDVQVDVQWTQNVNQQEDIRVLSESYIETAGGVQVMGKWDAAAQDGVILRPGFHAYPGSNVQIDTQDSCLNVQLANHRPPAIDYQAVDVPAKADPMERSPAINGIPTQEASSPAGVLSPNPARAGQVVWLSETPTYLRITDLDGRVQLETQDPETRRIHPDSNWPSGVYLVQWQDQAGEWKTERLVIQGF
jgi:hypothetical protein